MSKAEIEALREAVKELEMALHEVLPVLRKNGYRAMAAKIEKLLGES